MGRGCLRSLYSSFCSYTCQASNKLSACLSSLWTFRWNAMSGYQRCWHAKSSWSIHPLWPILHRDKRADILILLISCHPELRRRRVQNLHGQTRYISTLVLWFSWALDWVVFRVRSRCGYVLPKTCWGTSSRSCPRFRYSGSWGRKNIQRPGHLCNSGSLQLQVLGLSLIKKQNDRSASLKPFASVFGDGCSSDVFPHQLTPWGPTSQSDPLKRVGRRAKATRTRLETMLDHSSGKSWFVAGCSWNGPYKAMWAMCSLQIMCLKWQYSWTLLGSKAFFVAKSEIQKPGPPMNAKKPLDLHKQFCFKEISNAEAGHKISWRWLTETISWRKAKWIKMTCFWSISKRKWEQHPKIHLPRLTWDTFPNLQGVNGPF